MQNLIKNNFKDKLYKLLKKDSRLWDKEKKELNETLLKDLTDKIDEQLLDLLLSDNQVKEKFFLKVKGLFVFKVNEFKFFIDENKLDNSYTQYKNRIGLRAGDKLLSERDEVVLDWPFKDCVLKGGMTKEDQKRNEIFFNEVLAQDEIDRLYEPKALKNWKRYTKNGKEKVKELKRNADGTIKENLIIKGNNLLVLHSLKEQFAGEVKLIYIDPPYNRDEDGFYNDRFKHSTWLTFMKNRLEIANELLSNKGAIFISIDDNEMAYLKALCDEIFGRDSFLAQIAYERSGVSGLGQGGDFLVNTHESILCYKKIGFEVVDNSGENPFTYEDMKRYNKIFLNAGRKKEVKRFIAPSTKKPVIIYKHEGESINTISLKNFKERQKEIEKEYNNNFSKIFRNTSIQEENQFQNKILSLCGKGLYSADYTVSRGKKKGEKITAYYLNKQVFAWLCETAKLEDNTIVKTNKLSDFWDHASIPKADLANEGGVKLRRGKKPENLLRKLIELATKKGDLVLDFFVGSGTTCAVAHKIGRCYIGIEQLDYGDNDCLKRIKNVIAGDKTGISKKVNWKGGGDFVHVELAKWNEEAKEKILKTKNFKELIVLFDGLYKKYFLNYTVKVKDFREKVVQEEEFKNLPFENQKKLLVEMLDMNQLYINYSEREDKKYELSKDDVNLTEKFYNQE